MIDTPAGLQAKKTREMEKCTACRQDRVECIPRNREWEGAQQKCEHCESHKEDCGPNYRDKDDPEILRRKDTRAEASSHAVLEQPLAGTLDEHWGVSVSETAERECQQPARGRLPRSSDSEQTKLADSTAEQITEKAISNLDEMNALGTVWTSIRFRTLPADPPCSLPLEMFVKTRLQLSFVSVYTLGVQCHDQHLFDHARWILSALSSAMGRYDMLRDGLNRDQLLKMANIFQDLGLQWECEHMLTLTYRSITEGALDYMDTLLHLIPDPIRRIETGAIVTKAEVHHHADVVILATGFETTRSSILISGQDGITLDEHWTRSGGRAAYKSVSVAGFPNLFLLNGPNSISAHSSALASIEKFVDLILKVAKPVILRFKSMVEVKSGSEQQYTKEVQEALKSRVWQDCRSYYQDEPANNFFLYPWHGYTMYFQTHFESLAAWDYR